MSNQEISVEKSVGNVVEKSVESSVGNAVGNVVIKDIPVRKKRGRPKVNRAECPQEKSTEIKIPKKRGRKPKGGKIIYTTLIDNNKFQPEFNVILHLKCNSKDLAYKNKVISNVSSYNSDEYKEIYLNEADELEKNKHCEPDTNQPDMVSIWSKIKELSINLHQNNISNKKSACFWCTCDFDTPPIYIPKYSLQDKYHCYGCFCSPECATSHLFNEPIDSSIRFSRYHLLNYLYGKIYNYETNFKPAPNPHYTLEKYYGNLSIDEYRKLSNRKNLLFIVDKPLTRVLPELHEDTDDFILNHNSIPASNKFTLRKKQKQTKVQILNNNFNLHL